MTHNSRINTSSRGYPALSLLSSWDLYFPVLRCYLHCVTSSVKDVLHFPTETQSQPAEKTPRSPITGIHTGKSVLCSARQIRFIPITTTNLSGLGICNDNRRRIGEMVATEAGVRSHTGMTICDKPEKGVEPRPLCRLAQH